MDTRALWQSKKGTSFLIAIIAIVILVILGFIFKQDVTSAFGYICTLLGIHHSSQGAVDWQSAKNNVQPVIDTIKNITQTTEVPQTADGEIQNVNLDEVIYKDFKPQLKLDLSSSQREDLADFFSHWKKYKNTYDLVSAPSDCPAILMAALHWRECSGSFKQYLHNGDPLGRPTTHVPKGVFFNNWNDAAIDAIKREVSAKHASGMTAGETSLEDMCTFAEHYNGMGYTKKGVPSPYVFAGTTGYTSGKFVEDGEYSSSAVDDQLGVLVMLRQLAGYNPDTSVA
jgi:lysozyme family protein